jgi:hypothetical protein
MAALAVVLSFFAYHSVLSGWLEQLVSFIDFAAERSSAQYKEPLPGLTKFGLFVLSASLLILLLLGTTAFALVRKRWQAAHVLAAVSTVAILSWPQFAIERPDPSHLADRSFAILLAVAAIYINRPVRGVGSRFGRVCRRGFGPALMAWPLALAFWSLSGRSVGTAVGTIMGPRSTIDVRGEQVRIADPRMATALAYLDRCLGHGELLASLPYAPGVNFLLRSEFPSRQVYYVPHSANRVGSEEELLAGLKKPDLTYLFFDPLPQLSSDPSATFPVYALETFRMINLDFVGVASGRRNLVYRKRSAGVPSGCAAQGGEQVSTSSPDLSAPKG